MSPVFKIVRAAEWRAAESEGVYRGSANDKEDGFLHFSTAEQLIGTLTRHYAGAEDIILVAVDAALLGDNLKFEPSRDGALFPHLYADLPISAVRWTGPITQDGKGEFILPAMR